MQSHHLKVQSDILSAPYLAWGSGNDMFPGLFAVMTKVPLAMYL